jgi:hypothetical protein
MNDNKAGDDLSLWHMEEAFWLQGIEAYRRAMRDDAVMVFPDPTGVLMGNEVFAALAAAPRWAEVSISERRILRAGPGVVLLVYRALAKREQAEYRALCSSSYASNDGVWKLVHHQQTPVESAA